MYCKKNTGIWHKPLSNINFCFNFINISQYDFPPFLLRGESKVKKLDIPTCCELHYCKDGPVRNGQIGQRPPSINPERLKDFGEEDYLNGGVKTWEMKLTSPNEKLLRDSVSHPDRISQPAYNKFIKFEDISAAAFKIQCGVQKTLCTVWYLSFHNISLQDVSRHSGNHLPLRHPANFSGAVVETLVLLYLRHGLFQIRLMKVIYKSSLFS